MPASEAGALRGVRVQISPSAPNGFRASCAGAYPPLVPAVAGVGTPRRLWPPWWHLQRGSGGTVDTPGREPGTPQGCAGPTPAFRTHLDVAQLGQRAWFGSRRSGVQISPSRPSGSSMASGVAGTRPALNRKIGGPNPPSPASTPRGAAWRGDGAAVPRPAGPGGPMPVAQRKSGRLQNDQVGVRILAGMLGSFTCLP
jgi:hypothetical protein